MVWIYCLWNMASHFFHPTPHLQQNRPDVTISPFPKPYHYNKIPEVCSIPFVTMELLWLILVPLAVGHAGPLWWVMTWPFYSLSLYCEASSFFLALFSLGSQHSFQFLKEVSLRNVVARGRETRIQQNNSPVYQRELWNLRRTLIFFNLALHAWK